MLKKQLNALKSLLSSNLNHRFDKALLIYETKFTRYSSGNISKSIQIKNDNPNLKLANLLLGINDCNQYYSQEIKISLICNLLI
jgi:hypothetical protein